MGELTFFLGLQVKQKEDGIFISQDKYMTEILKKFGFTDVKTTSTPMETQKPLLKDADGEDIDEHLYRSMIGSLMYLTSSKALNTGLQYVLVQESQVNPKVFTSYAVKRIFRYFKKATKIGSYVAFLEKPTESEGFEEIVDFLNANPIKYALTVNLTVYLDKKKVIITESTIRRDLQLEDAEGTECLPTATIFEQLTRIGAKTTEEPNLVSLLQLQLSA
ncbi:uncharacterized mitochondrial protein-like protein [Tanacetum coccineum]